MKTLIKIAAIALLIGCAEVDPQPASEKSHEWEYVIRQIETAAQGIDTVSELNIFLTNHMGIYEVYSNDAAFVHAYNQAIEQVRRGL